MPSAEATREITLPAGVKYSKPQGRNDEVEFDPKSITLKALAAFVYEMMNAKKTTNLVQIAVQGDKSSFAWLSNHNVGEKEDSIVINDFLVQLQEGIKARSIKL